MQLKEHVRHVTTRYDLCAERRHGSPCSALTHGRRRLGDCAGDVTGLRTWPVDEAVTWCVQKLFARAAEG
jgi:hypothetical protein